MDNEGLTRLPSERRNGERYTVKFTGKKLTYEGISIPVDENGTRKYLTFQTKENSSKDDRRPIESVSVVVDKDDKRKLDIPLWINDRHSNIIDYEDCPMYSINDLKKVVNISITHTGMAICVTLSLVNGMMKTATIQDFIGAVSLVAIVFALIKR